jgi:hypothetical protein
MANRTQDRFYFIPKEQMTNMLRDGLESTIDTSGAIVLKEIIHYSTGPHINYTIRLSDYIVPEHIIHTPEMEAYIGKIGTHAHIEATDDNRFGDAKSKLDRIVKKFEI